jgi:hypothetical protein
MGQLGFKEQFLKQNDSLIINNTSLRLYCLFNSKDSINKNFRFAEPLDGNVKICGNQNNVIINAGGISFQIKSNGVLLDSIRNTSCKKDIVTHNFGGSRRIKELDSGDVEITFDLDKKYIKTNIGTIEVSPQELQCDDTGTNPFRITTNGKEIVFKQGGNLIFFEFDSNKDKKKELYILNYFSCMRRFELYKIE